MKKILILITVTVLVLAACSPNKTTVDITEYKNFEEVIKAGENTEVTILMWGGNESINTYMDTFVADNLQEMYGITLKRVPMNAPDYLNKLLNEKKNNIEEGSADLLWINGENFRTAKDAQIINGPFTDLLPNLKNFYDQEASDLSVDSGVVIDGYEGIWGRAQLVFTYDESEVSGPPQNFDELKAWVMENPGKFTYPKLPDDFAGTAFVRTAYYELTGERDKFGEELTKSEFEELSKPVFDYFNEIAPYLWREGQAYPATQAQLDELFRNGEVSFTMGFEVGKTAGLVAEGVYSESVKTYVFETGTIGNSHYLAIPYNSPEKAGALLVMDFLQSPKAQLEKMKPTVWGDMPAFDVNKISDEEKDLLATFEDVEGAISLDELTSKRLPEMKAEYTDWIKELWVKNIEG